MAEHTEEFKQAAIHMLERHMEGHKWVEKHEKEIDYKVDDAYGLRVVREDTKGVVSDQFAGDDLTILIGLMPIITKLEERIGINDMTMLALKEQVRGVDANDQKDLLNAILEKLAEASDE